VVEHPENVNASVLDAIPDVCPYGALDKSNGTFQWHRDKCTSCLGCAGMMVTNGVWEPPELNFMAAQAAMADGCLAVMKALDGKVAFLNLAIDVSPWCDCVDFADKPLVPHVGLFAASDPVAVDQACIDAVRASAGSPGTASEDFDVLEPGSHKFMHASSFIHGLGEELQLNVGKRIGLGTSEYDLIQVEPGTTAEPYVYRLDPRRVGARYRGLFAREDPFPAGRYDGRGFDRLDEVDLDAVR
jgi:uncharacterized Fe-S center protein